MLGVWRFASVVSLIMYGYAGLGMILMQSSGVNSEHSNTVNFDSMFDPPEFCSVVVTSYYSRFKVWIHDHLVSAFDDRFLGQSVVVRMRSRSYCFLLNIYGLEVINLAISEFFLTQIAGPLITNTALRYGFLFIFYRIISLLPLSCAPYSLL